MLSTQKYYGKNGPYLRDHKSYFSKKVLNEDVEFIQSSLALTKHDRCLELQCGHGRMVIALNAKGYNVDGLDFSTYMLQLSQQEAKKRNLKINFFHKNINHFTLSKKYNKVFIFFPDWTGVDFKKVLMNVKKILVKGGLFFYDHYNIFCILNYLRQNKKQGKKFVFDPVRMIIKEVGYDEGVRYYVYPELKNLFEMNGFDIVATYGDWVFDSKGYSLDSPRIRIVARKK